MSSSKRVSRRLFAKLPYAKARCLCSGPTTTWLQDGINDAAAMRSSDVGISGTPVDGQSPQISSAAETAGINGVEEGRRTYGNTIKYIKATATLTCCPFWWSASSRRSAYERPSLLLGLAYRYLHRDSVGQR